DPVLLAERRPARTAVRLQRRGVDRDRVPGGGAPDLRRPGRGGPDRRPGGAAAVHRPQPQPVERGRVRQPLRPLDGGLGGDHRLHRLRLGRLPAPAQPGAEGRRPRSVPDRVHHRVGAGPDHPGARRRGDHGRPGRTRPRRTGDQRPDVHGSRSRSDRRRPDRPVHSRLSPTTHREGDHSMSANGTPATSTYAVPAPVERPTAAPNTAYLIASGDLRESANTAGWPTQQELEAGVIKAFRAHGWNVVRANPVDPATGHGFISSQRMGLEVFKQIPPDAPLIVAEAVWQYSHHVLAGLRTHQGPILAVANFAGEWPGLVGLLGLNAGLTKMGKPYSTIWSVDFTDD